MTTLLMRNMQYQRLWRWLAASLLLAGLTFAGCSSAGRIGRQLDKTWESPGMDRQFTGLLIVDAERGDTLYARNAKKAFTPASTLKLFTLYAALKTLPDRIPALQYSYQGDTLVVKGTGDPSALHHDLQDSTAYHFMKRAVHLAMANTHMESKAYGPGWAWDDFDRYYMPMRSAFPIYGNTLRMVATGDSLRAVPASLKDSVVRGASPLRRALESNQFYRRPADGDTLDIPLFTNPKRERQFWSGALGRAVSQAGTPESDYEILYGIPADSLYKRMMKESDNFVAEQLMLLVSGTLGQLLDFERARDYALDSLLKDIPQKPRWVDGSGLSRYNLVSPESLVYLLGKLYREVPRDRLYGILASGGGRGTLEKRFDEGPQAYLFGKTGSLSNNHNLCGYLITRSGKTVLFAFMNNHYQQPGSQVRFRMDRLLKWVRDAY